jgi:hypothetical protein
MPKPILVAALRPTQMTLGLKEVRRRGARIMELDAGARHTYIQEREVPCVIGPGKALFLIDRHHMCRALLEAGHDTVLCDIVSDVSALDEDEFWRFLDLRGWVHPFDRNGKRCPVSALPHKISELVDDPYRALAGDLRRGSGFDKADTPYEEFIWADFLRFRIPLEAVRADFDKASREALKLARSQAANHLPGWKGA